MPPKKGGGAVLELAPRKVQDVQDAATPAAAAKALEGLVGLCAEEGGACALTGSGALEALATVVRGMDDGALTTAHVDAAAAASGFLKALAAAPDACPGQLGSDSGVVEAYVELLGGPNGAAAAATEEAVHVWRHASIALAVIASSHDGRARLHLCGGASALVPLLKPSLAAHVSMQAAAADALGSCAQSALARIELRASEPQLVELVALVATPPGAGAEELSRCARLLGALAQCLHDPPLRASLLRSPLLSAAAALACAARDAKDDAISAEVRAGAATLLAIGAHSAAGAAEIVARSLLGPMIGVVGASVADGAAEPSSAHRSR